MYKALPTMRESAAALHHHVSTEQDPQKRQRRQALALVARGHAPSRLAIAELLAVPRHPGRAWLATYEHRGRNMLLTLQKAPGKRRALTPAGLAQLQTRLRQPQGFGSYRESQPYLATDHHGRLAYSTVHGIVRSQLQVKPKSPRRSPPKKSLRPSPPFQHPSPPSFPPV
jgi:transposase